MKQVIKIFSLRNNITIGREELIDFLRGGAMVLVLLHHSGVPFGQLILAFHMPLFFILSGYLEFIVEGTKRTFGDYVKKRFMRLIVPYFSFETLNLIIWCIKCVAEHQNLPGIESIISIVTCINNEYMGLYGRLWFLPCMFVADIYVWLILHFLRNNKCGQFVAIFVLFALSYVTDKIIPFRLPFTIDTALFAAAFIMLGYLFGDSIRVMISKGNELCKIFLAVCMLLYLVYAVYFLNAKVLMYINSYGEYTVSICTAIAGSVVYLIFMSCLYRLVYNLQLIKNVFLWYGHNSLASFPIHLIIKMFILWYVPILSRWYFLFIVMLFLNIPVVNVITYYFPFMLGKKRVREL